MEKIILRFEAGESRYNPGKGCNYMFAELPDDEELYSEVVIPEDCDDADYFAYDELKAEIIRQAEKKAGIPAETLVFPYDED